MAFTIKNAAVQLGKAAEHATEIVTTGNATNILKHEASSKHFEDFISKKFSSIFKPIKYKFCCNSLDRRSTESKSKNLFLKQYPYHFILIGCKCHTSLEAGL